MRFLRENSLSLVLLTLFTLAMLGQAFTGWYSDNDARGLHHEFSVTLRAYLESGAFVGNVRKLGE